VTNGSEGRKPQGETSEKERRERERITEIPKREKDRPASRKPPPKSRKRDS
jgi:hypothetical protein